MKLYSTTIGVAILVVFLFITNAISQPDTAWKRVTTGEGYTVEVDSVSLKFDADGVVGAKFRTVYSKPEPLGNDPNTKYKIRVETMQFKPDRTYRSSNISLIDGDGKSLAERAEPSAWKPMRTSAWAWLKALDDLHPFGEWSVVTYRLVDGSGRQGDQTDLNSLIGTSIYLRMNSATAGKRQCQWPRYQTRQMKDEDVERLVGVLLKPLKLEVAPVEIVSLTCSQQDWPAGQSVLVPIDQNRMLMLWEGAFLELHRPRSNKFPIPITVQDVTNKSVIVTSPN